MSYEKIRRSTPQSTTNGTHKGVINTKSGGIAEGRESKTAQKIYAPAVYSLHGQPSKKFKPDNTISFSDEDYEGIITPHDDALVITASITDYLVNKVLMGNRSNILYHRAFAQMDLKGMQMDKCTEAPLYGFWNNPVQIKGTITLPLALGHSPCRTQTTV